MATKQDVFQGVQIGKFDNIEELSSAVKRHISDLPFIVCIGTDRNTGDAMGPFVGTYLKDKGYSNVIGTIDDPVHAQNMEEKIKLIPEGCKVLAIDACLGKTESVGKHIFQSGSIKAGAGVGKGLPDVGDFSIASVVNVSTADNTMNHLLLGTTRLSLVMKMARELVEVIESAFPIESKFTSA